MPIVMVSVQKTVSISMDMNNNRTTGTDVRQLWPVAVYAVLMVIGIPWYWESDDYSIIFGMPAWVSIAIITSFAASSFTAWLLRRPWPIAPAGEDED